ncbi:MAG: decaprenyl-phosphate phosphoribosyltransferase [Actinomycetes bacterium]
MSILGSPSVLTSTPVTRPGPLDLARGVLRSTRPGQWPKNLLVAAAPLAGATLGRPEVPVGLALTFVALTLTSGGLYLFNDAMDIERDRAHPTKCRRPVAAGLIPRSWALVLSAFFVVAGLAVALAPDHTGRAGMVVAGYAVITIAYSRWLKRVPVLEMVAVASGFVLRAVAGALATRTPPSLWFLIVAAGGALAVTVAKRGIELSGLGPRALVHRPVLAAYSVRGLRRARVALLVLTLGAYAGWVLTRHGTWVRGMDLASLVPLAIALVRFDVLAGRASTDPSGIAVEHLIVHDRPMRWAELAWVVLFLAGLLVG